MTVDRSEDELRVRRPGWKKDMMRFSGGKKQRRKKMCVFQSSRLQFANRKLCLRFLCFRHNRVLRNLSITAPPPYMPNCSRPTRKLTNMCLLACSPDKSLISAIYSQTITQEIVHV